MTVRQVFYQLVSRGVIEKTEAQYQGTVIRLMTEMRLTVSCRMTGWWMRAAGFATPRPSTTFRMPSSTRRGSIAAARWRSPTTYVEIWCEKDALAGAMWDVTSDYDVPLMVSRGMPSITFLHGTALEIQARCRARQASYIYQFGDHDPSGVLIPQTIERRLDEMCEKLDCPPPDVKRVALTEAQIRRYRLPTRPTKREGNTHAADSRVTASNWMRCRRGYCATWCAR